MRDSQIGKMRLRYSQSLLLATASLVAVLVPGVCAGKTSIYIDKIPLYSSLPECAQERVSAIVRAQSSGCGDDMALTSFSCFCVDSSSYFNSIISTDVDATCQSTGTQAGRITSTATLGASVTAAADIASALNVFHSYCMKTTELALYAGSTTPTDTITQAPQSTTATTTSTSTSTSSPTPKSKKIPTAVIAVPVVIGVLVIAGAFGILFWLRRRAAKQKGPYTEYHMKSNRNPRAELAGDYHETPEVHGDTIKYRYELENRELHGERAELHGDDLKGMGSGMKT